MICAAVIIEYQFVQIESNVSVDKRRLTGLGA